MCRKATMGNERVRHAELSRENRCRVFHTLECVFGTFYRLRFAPPVANDITSAPQTDECCQKTLIELTINNKTVFVGKGASVAVAILASEVGHFRSSATGEPRFPVCGMGICFECRVTIDGTSHQRSCQTLAENGMIVQTDE